MGSIDKVGKIDLGKSVGNPDFLPILRVLDKPRTHCTMLIDMDLTAKNPLGNDAVRSSIKSAYLYIMCE